MIDNVRDLIIRHEGKKNYAYQDTEGLWTIGVGHLIDSRRGGSIPDSIVYELLDLDIADRILNLPSWITSDRLGSVRYACIVDMAFNLGVDGLMQFTQTLKAVFEGRWEDASVLMMQSKWAKQVGPRASRLSQMMRTGEWPTS